MLIKNMFAKEIDRDIKGVIKVGQADDENVRQELEEYVVTRELSKHFADFFSSYKKGITGNTDKMGVWISGFFGSGKSHFLKILSYILENRVVDGKTAIDYFVDDNKIVDEMVLADMKLAAGTSTDVILFNIDSKSSMADSQNNKEAILSVFLKVFNQHLGYYGANPHLADLERTLTEENKYDEFKSAFLEIRGKSWDDSRHNFRFIQDDVCDALTQINYCSEDASRNLCESFTGNYELDIHTFSKMIKKHIDTKGSNHHVVFMVDEIGQYIGERTDLMLNLQTVAEDLGTECGGKAWIVVTSQQDIDSITKVKGNDFSKIQGRFDTRLSLSSSDVSEVIKKRILEKSDSAAQNLRLLFEEKEVVVKNLIMFNDGIEKKLYKDKYDFAEVYPFIPYQFNLLGDVLTSIRTHGASGKHLAEGERSMLSLYRESAMSVMNCEEPTIIPFSNFYNALEQFLDHSHKVVITRAWDNEYLNPNKEDYSFEVEVLKTLFMIKYVDGSIIANLENITSLMADNIDQSRIALKDKVEVALHKLCRQNYVQKSGDLYVFLSNEEQEINREIESQSVETAEITNKISELIFDKLYDEKKYKYPKFNGRYAFGFNQIVDERPYKNNQSFDISLKFLTPDYDGNLDEATLRMMSSQGSYVLVKLSDDRAFIDELRGALKIEKYLRLDKASVATKYEQIKDAKRKEMRDRNANAQIFLEESLRNSEIYASGDKLQIAVKDIRGRINEALGKLVQTVFHKLSYIDTAMGEAHIRGVLKGSQTSQISLDNTNQVPNINAVNDAKDYIVMNSSRHTKTSMKAIKDRFIKAPYGFIEDDVEWVIAKLFKDGDIAFFVNGEVITLLSKTDDEIFRYINRKEYSEKLLVETRIGGTEKQKKISRELARELFSASISETDDDSILRNFIRLSNNLKNELEKIERDYQHQPKYPGQSVVRNGKKLLIDIIGIQYSAEFFNAIEKSKDEYLDFAEDYAPIKAFFEGEQKDIWDKALKLMKIYEESKTFIVSEAIETTISDITDIIRSANPYGKIRLLPELLENYTAYYMELLNSLEEPVLKAIEEARTRVVEELSGKECHDLLKDRVARAFTEIKDKATTCNNVATLQNIKLEADALKLRLLNLITDEETKMLRAKAEKELAEQKAAGVPEIEIERTPVAIPKQRKNISIKSINLESTWKVETEEDVDRYIEKLRADLKKQLKDNTIINIEF